MTQTFQSLLELENSRKWRNSVKIAKSGKQDPQQEQQEQQEQQQQLSNF